MADPKYADLPGIDTQPDVYETNDLPEDDQLQHVPAELNSEVVEKLTIDTKDAFNKFKDKTLLSGQVDFSDRISQSRRTGYVAPKKEYEILADGSQERETPVQRFQRLQHEIRELGEDVDKMQKTAKDDTSAVGASPAALMKDISVLQQQLYGLHLEKILGSESVIDASDPQGTLPKKLFNQLDSFKKEATQAGTPSKKDAPATKDGHVTYELYYRPEQNKFTQVSKAAELEQRLNRLEAVLGQDPQKLASLTADTSSRSLLESISQLQARVSILDPAQVDHIEARVQSLLQRLDQVSEKKSAVEDAGKESKISELYEMVEKWDSVAETLPKVVDRLQALKDLHEQALQFSQAISQLDTAQQQLTTSMGSQDTLLKEMKDSFAANIAAIQSNCESLDGRMKAFKK